MGKLSFEWPVMDPDGEYRIEDVHAFANSGDSSARGLLEFIGRLRYRDTLRDNKERPLLSDSPDQFVTEPGIRIGIIYEWSLDRL